MKWMGSFDKFLCDFDLCDLWSPQKIQKIKCQIAVDISSQTHGNDIILKFVSRKWLTKECRYCQEGYQDNINFWPSSGA